jgi:hypothetical protein
MRRVVPHSASLYTRFDNNSERSRDSAILHWFLREKFSKTGF